MTIAKLQNNKHPESIKLCSHPLSYHHSMALEVILLVGVFDAPLAKICGKEV